MAHDTSDQLLDTRAEETSDSATDDRLADAALPAALESQIVEAVESKVQKGVAARLARWKLQAKDLCLRIFTTTVTTEVEVDDAGVEAADVDASAVAVEEPVKPAPSPKRPWTRGWDVIKAHQGLCALLLVVAVAAGLFASGRWSTDTEENDSAGGSAPLAFEEIDVLPPGRAKPRETTGIPEFKQAQPIQTAEHESGPRLGSQTFEGGPSLSGPSLNAPPSRPAGRSAWLTGTIEDVTGNTANVRQIGHVDLPASSSSQRR